MTLLKNLQESFDIRLDQAEEIISDLKDTYLKRSEKKKKGIKRYDKSLRTYGKPLRETIYASLESQKKKRGEKGKKPNEK